MLLEHAGDTEGGVAWRRLLDEYEPRTAGRQCDLLQERVHYGFPRAAVDEVELLLRRRSALSGEDVSESLKVALVQKGVTDDALEHPPCCTPHAFRTSSGVREEVRSVLIMRQALDANGKGKGKDKDRPDSEMTCYYCSKIGHRSKGRLLELAGSTEVEGESGSEGGRRVQEGCEEGSCCRGRRIARGGPTERLRERVLGLVG